MAGRIETTSPPQQAARKPAPRRRAPSLAAGAAVLKAQLRLLPAAPGVYRMVDHGGEVLYVGKARNLRHRLASYTRIGRLSNRLGRMVAETAGLEVVTTHTEVEALLLESNLIKRFRPRYNVLLRDDKSFPYILLTADHDWPRLLKYRGARSRAGEYFGPFASAGAVTRTLNALERAFLLRSCSDAMFAGRTRPCLKFQLKRCSAPCVGRIDRAAYGELLRQTRAFLAGRSKEVQQDLAAEMDAAADGLEFERAARCRDRIRAMSQILAHQGINLEGAGLEDADVIAAHGEGGHSCVQVFFFRGGRNNGNRAYFPRHDRSVELPEVLAAFIGQFYDNKPPPPQVLLSHKPPQQGLIAEALSLRANRRVRLTCPQRGAKRKVVAHARLNAREALARRLAESSSQRLLLERLAALVGLDGAPTRIEVFDNSHISGTGAIGAMIVAGHDGFVKSAYRRFTIRGARRRGSNGAGDEAGFSPGDDYAMMREMLTRRFMRAQAEDPDRTLGQWPELILIDGGQGQLNVALRVLAELGVDDVAVAAVAKGPDRDAGRERIHLPRRQPIQLDERDAVLHFVQRLRDEAHRFAIGGHRAKRAKAAAHSPLDDIPGIGARRKKALLRHFGSARGVTRAGLEDLEQVDGISRAVAQRVYDYFHGET